MILASLLLALAARFPVSLLPEFEAAPPARTSLRGMLRVQVEPFGDAFLVVSSHEYIYWWNRYAMIVSADGEPLLPEAIDLGYGAVGNTGIATNGQTALIVSGANGYLSGVLLDRSGAARTIEIHKLSHAPFSPRDNGGSPDVIWDGTQFLVISTLEVPNGSALKRVPILTRVSESGSILENDIPGGIDAALAVARNRITILGSSREFQMLNGTSLGEITTLPENESLADLAAGDDGFLVLATRGESELRAYHLDAAGRRDRAPFSLPRQSGTSSVAWDGNAWLVTNGSGAVLRVTSDGTLLDTITGAPATLVASNGTASIVINGADPVRTARLGSTQQHEINISRIERTQPVLAGDAVIWKDERGIWRNTIGSNTPQLFAENITQFRDAASGATGTLIVFDADDGLRAQILGSESLLLSDDPNTFNRRSVRSIATPDGFVVAYIERFTLHVARISAHGTVEQSDIATSVSGTLAIADANHKLLVSWVTQFGALQGAFVGEEKSFEIASADKSPRAISIATDGDRFLVTWQSGDINTGNVRIGANLVNRDGTIAGDFVSTNSEKFEHRALWTGMNYLVVWTQFDTPSDKSLHGIRIDTDGALLDNPEINLGNLVSDAGAKLDTFDAKMVAPERLLIAYRRFTKTPAPLDHDILLRYAVPLPRRRITK